MPKLSEMSNGELSKYLSAYEGKLSAEPGNEDYQKSIRALKKEMAKRNPVSTPLEEPEVPDIPLAAMVEPSKPVVEKFHSDEDDHSIYEDATFGTRFLAVVIDTVFLVIIISVVSAIIEMSMPKEQIVAMGLLTLFINNFLIPALYVYVPVCKRGQTLGKMILKIKIVNNDNTEDLKVSTVIIREAIGKLISSLIFMVGYLVHLSGRPTWHDSLAKTRVVKLD